MKYSLEWLQHLYLQGDLITSNIKYSLECLQQLYLQGDYNKFEIFSTMITTIVASGWLQRIWNIL